MKTIWARIGYTLNVTDKEYDKLLNLSKDEYGRIDDLELTEKWIAKFVKHGEPDGDAYIPACIFEEI